MHQNSAKQKEMKVVSMVYLSYIKIYNNSIDNLLGEV